MQINNGKLKTLGERSTPSSATMNIALSHLWFGPTFHNEKPTSDHLKHGMPLCVKCFIGWTVYLQDTTANITYTYMCNISSHNDPYIYEAKTCSPVVTLLLYLLESSYIKEQKMMAVKIMVGSVLLCPLLQNNFLYTDASLCEYCYSVDFTILI
jgi:hypothetical protein